jgi:hypothetical protein
MMVLSDALTASGTRRLSPVQWNKDGCRGFDVEVRKDVPAFDEGMIRRALLRGSLVCGNVDGLSLALNRKLWAIGYVARVQSDPVDRSIVVEVSMSRS